MENKFEDLIDRTTGERIPLTRFGRYSLSVGRGSNIKPVCITWLRVKPNRLISVEVYSQDSYTIDSIEDIEDIISKQKDIKKDLRKGLRKYLKRIRKGRWKNARVYREINKKLYKKDQLVCMKSIHGWRIFQGRMSKLFDELIDMSKDQKEYEKYLECYKKALASINELEVEKRYLKQRTSHNKTSDVF